MRNSIIDIKITDATSVDEPLTLAQVKTHLLVDHTLDDVYLQDLITRCRKSVENYCSISIVEKEIVLIADWNQELALPNGPVVEVTDVQFKGDIRGTYQTLTENDDYFLDGSRFASNYEGRHKITYTVGMDTVDNDLKLALLNEIAYRYENRGDQINRYASQDVGLSEGAEDLLKPYIDYSWR